MHDFSDKHYAGELRLEECPTHGRDVRAIMVCRHVLDRSEPAVCDDGVLVHCRLEDCQVDDMSSVVDGFSCESCFRSKGLA